LFVLHGWVSAILFPLFVLFFARMVFCFLFLFCNCSCHSFTSNVVYIPVYVPYHYINLEKALLATKTVVLRILSSLTGIQSTYVPHFLVTFAIDRQCCMVLEYLSLSIFSSLIYPPDTTRCPPTLNITFHHSTDIIFWKTRVPMASQDLLYGLVPQPHRILAESSTPHPISLPIGHGSGSPFSSMLRAWLGFRSRPAASVPCSRVKSVLPTFRFVVQCCPFYDFSRGRRLAGSCKLECRSHKTTISEGFRICGVKRSRFA
jgi:hypothetical protein